MPRQRRVSQGGLAYHVLNRANGRDRIFHRPEDYAAFEAVLEEAVDRVPMRILAYCIMPNHWHLVLWPVGDGDLSRFVGWLTLTHTHRWRAWREEVGWGHLYQGRFKSFVVQDDEHLLIVLRYVERNPLRAGLVDRAEAWQWSSLWRRVHGTPSDRRLLSAWPVDCPCDWLTWVNRPQTEAELDALRRSVRRGRPFGTAAWVEDTAARFGLTSTLRDRGRPTKRGQDPFS